MPVRYRTAPGQGSPVTLTTLVSDHYGGARRDTADHVERFYFTRELGGTRWERWQNAKGNRQYDAAAVAGGRGAFRRDRPLRPRADAGGRRRLRADRLPRMDPDRRNHDPAGDPPGFFLKAVRERPGHARGLRRARRREIAPPPARFFRPKA